MLYAHIYVCIYVCVHMLSINIFFAQCYTTTFDISTKYSLQLAHLGAIWFVVSEGCCSPGCSISWVFSSSLAVQQRQTSSCLHLANFTVKVSARFLQNVHPYGLQSCTYFCKTSITGILSQPQAVAVLLRYALSTCLTPMTHPTLWFKRIYINHLQLNKQMIGIPEKTDSVKAASCYCNTLPQLKA